MFIVGNWVLLFASHSRASIAIGTAVYNVQPFMLGLGGVSRREGHGAQAPGLGFLGLVPGMLAIVSAPATVTPRAGTTCSVSSWRSLPRAAALPR